MNVYYTSLNRPEVPTLTLPALSVDRSCSSQSARFFRRAPHSRHLQRPSVSEVNQELLTSRQYKYAPPTTSPFVVKLTSTNVTHSNPLPTPRSASSRIVFDELNIPNAAKCRINTPSPSISAFANLSRHSQSH
ncbi:hypothetical protein GEMRC1_006293 [Eukaryota sp. GEM-RC1]